MFPMVHLPGVMGLSDFTQLKNATITIGGKEFKHLLCLVVRKTLVSLTPKGFKI